jgi:hypothetical protein
MYELLETVMEPWLAALATAGIAILFSVLVLVLARLAMRVVTPPAPKAARSGLGLAAEIGSILGKDARDFVENNSLSTLGILAVVGFALGISPRLRKALWKIL